MRPTGVALLVLALGFAAPHGVRADARPTSGDMSILSGRTLGNGETALAAAVGCPDLRAEVMLAPSSTSNVGLRGGLVYGSPVMGLGNGAGGTATIPMRLHLSGRERLDVALTAEATFAAGEGARVGQEQSFANDFGWAAQGALGALGGLRVSDAVTLTLGVLGETAFVDVPDSSDGQHLVGGVVGVLAAEALLSRDTMLFGELRGGYGFAPDRLFDGHEILRLSLGTAYLL